MIKHYYVFTYRNGVLRKLFHEHRQQGRGIRIKDAALIIVAPYWDDPVPALLPKVHRDNCIQIEGIKAGGDETVAEKEP